MSSTSDHSEPFFSEIVENWPDIATKLVELLGNSSPSEGELRVMFDSQRSVLKTWASRSAEQTKSREESLSSLSGAVIELLLVQIFQASRDVDRKQTVLEALWTLLEPAIRRQAEKLLEGARSLSDFGDRIGDLIQDGFIVFERKLEKFDTSKEARVQTFLSHCFRNHFINCLKSQNRKRCEGSPELLDRQADHRKANRDRMRLVEDVLDKEAAQGPDMAERVQAFRKHRIEGYTMADVVKDMGRSLGWVHKSTKAIEELLKEELRD